MTRMGSWLRELVYGLGFLGSAIVGALLILNAFGQIGIDALPLAVRAGLGVLALGAAGYFLTRVAQAIRLRAPIQTIGAGGAIRVFPEAVRRLVRDTLREAFDIDDARVQIRPAGDGLRLSVQFSLPPDQRVPELGERVQAEVRRRVEERIGVTVDQVDVTAQAFKPAPSPSPSSAPPTATEARSPSGPTELSKERDRVD